MVVGGYCRLQTPLKLTLGVRETVAGHGLGALKRRPPPPPSNASLALGCHAVLRVSDVTPPLPTHTPPPAGLILWVMASVRMPHWEVARTM